MLIKLRQSEIEEGVKMYIASQGINLDGKDVEITFTASRGNDGITSDVDILPVKAAVVPNKPVARSSGEYVPPVKEEPATSPVSEEAKNLPFDPLPDLIQTGDDEAGEAELVPAVSLFGA